MKDSKKKSPIRTLQKKIITSISGSSSKETKWYSPRGKIPSNTYFTQLQNYHNTLKQIESSTLVDDLDATNESGGALILLSGDHAEHSLALWFVEELRSLPFTGCLRTLAYDTSTGRTASRAVEQLQRRAIKNDFLLILPSCLTRGDLVTTIKDCTKRGVHTWGMLRQSSRFKEVVKDHVSIQSTLHQSTALSRELFCIFDYTIMHLQTHLNNKQRMPKGLFSTRGKIAFEKQIPEVISDTYQTK